MGTSTNTVFSPLTTPKTINLDDLLTISQFADWRQISIETARNQIKAGIPGVIKHSKQDIRIHPRTYLEVSLKKSK